MEHIREALAKAKVTLDNAPHEVGKSPESEDEGLATAILEAGTVSTVSPSTPSSFAPPLVTLDPKLMERNRIVSFNSDDPNHVSFNLLRTRIRKVMTDSRWKTIGITSPTPDCGKTMIAINLALSLARSPELNVVLLDLDLKKPSVAKTIGTQSEASLGSFLRGRAKAEDCFVRVAPNLTIGLNGGRLPDSSELIQSQKLADLFRFIEARLSPDIVLIDLPPMGSGDDTLAILPQIDTAMLVIAAGKTTVKEVDNCERQISETGKFLGVVLNKSKAESSNHYYYY